MTSSNRVLLSDQQRKHTRGLHSTANVLVAGKLLLVFTDKQLYGRAISCFYPVLISIESKLKAHTELTELKPFGDLLEVATRVKALEEDLAYYLGDTWKSQVVTTAAVEEYLQLLDTVEAKNPVLLTAYFYGIYIALAAGGQILKRRIVNYFKLTEPQGVQFFTYPGGSDNAKAEIKRVFNQLGERSSAEFRQELLQESSNMFAMNNRVISSFPIGTKPALQCISRLLTNWYTVAGVTIIAILAYKLSRPAG